MPTISLKAHFDGQRILLDEPFDLPLDAPLLVTILVPDDESDRQAWIDAGLLTLARAFGEDEPTYTLDDLRQ